VEVHRALRWDGDLSTGADPDGIVIAAAFCSYDEACSNLASTPQWVREPMLAYLTDRWLGTRSFAYRLEGSGRAPATVVRLH
jgi:hypothetical protein